MSKTNKLGITFGAFDLLHAGHAEFFNAINEHVERIIVGLHIDPSVENPNKNKPIQSVFERSWQLGAVKGVDCVIPYETEKDIERMLGMISNITHYFVGEDHKNRPVTGEFLCAIKGIQIHYLPRMHDFSSTELRQRIKEFG